MKVSNLFWILVGSVVAIFLWSCGKETPQVQERPIPAAGEGTSRTFDHSAFAVVLRRFVNDLGMVDYEALKQDRESLDLYIGQLAAASPKSHPELFPSKEHRIAYWINAYNAIMLRVVIDHYPIRSVTDIMVAHGAFSRIFFPVGGRRMSLDDIEKGVLLEEFDDPRIHFTLSCASMSCPRLDRETFRADTLSERMDLEGRKFLNSPRGVRIDAERNVLRLSRYFDWYAEDFGPDPLKFIRRYLDEPNRKRLDELKDPDFEFMEYDWRLNDADAEWAPRNGS